MKQTQPFVDVIDPQKYHTKNKNFRTST